jgi:basic membrane lipoprotein Med (substrate-binding protein (PBP1-ABC) superfamily)
MYDQLKAVQAEMGGDKLEIAYSENMFNVPTPPRPFATMPADGYDLVIAHGAQYGDSLMEIAPDFPEDQLCLGHHHATPARRKGIDQRLRL